MKKISIISFYSGTIYRGVESWAESLKLRLNERCQIEIITGENFKWSSNNWFYHRYLILIHVFLSINKWIESDIIIPTNGTFQTLICRIFTFIFGKKMIVFGHSGPGADDKWNLWCNPDVFVVFSNTQLLWANRFKYPWTKTVVISHAVDINVFKPKKSVKKTVDILCVAANSPEKRVDLIKKAWGDVLVVGSGQENEFSFKDMPKIYSKARVFCFVPWEREAFGLVFLEAMACNLPVVTIDDPIRREIVGDAGIFVKDPENINNLSNAIKLALKTDWDDKPRRQAKKFSWDKIAKQYEDICINNI